MGISLDKDQKVSLKKESGEALNTIQLGLGWKAAKTGFLSKIFGSSVDLDASCVLFGKNGDVLDTVWFNKTESKCGAIKHFGDNLTGSTAEVDDEVIQFKLRDLPATVKTIAITIQSFSGQTFAEVESCFCRVVNNNEEICRYNLVDSGQAKGLFIGQLTRNASGWEFLARTSQIPGRKVDDAISTLKTLI